MNLSPLPIQKFFSNNGRPLAGGLLFTYVAGTSIKIATYVDSSGGTPNTNPIELDFRGECRIWLDIEQTYKFILAPAGDTDPPTKAIWSVDNIAAGVTLQELTQQIIGRILFPRTEAEIAALVVPTNFAVPSHDEIGVINASRYGLGEDSSGAVNVAALDSAVDVAREIGSGGLIVAPAGTLTLASTVTVDVDNVIIAGQGQGATIWRFDPGSPDICFHFTKGASSIVRSGIENCGFLSSNSVTKEAITIVDGRQCLVRRCAVNDGNWPGSASIALRTYGRDFLEFHHCDFECARPFVVSANPNFATLHVDMCVVGPEIQFATTETAGINVEVETGVELSNWRFETVNFARGKYGFYWDDTTTSLSSYQLSFINCRTEQTTDATGYSFYISSSAQNLQDVYFESCHFDPGMNGIFGRKLQRVTLKNSTLTGGVGRTNLDITFESLTELRIENTLLQTGSTVTLTNAVLIEAAPFTTVTSAISRNAFYRYNEGAVVSQRPALGYNDSYHWEYQGTLADSGTLNFPISAANGTLSALVEVEAVGATKQEGGSVSFSALGIQERTGSADFETTLVGSSLCVMDTGTDQLGVVNTLGESVGLLVRALIRK